MLIPKENIEAINNVFIVTKQRSGSTLLTLILGNSPTTQAIHEENIFFKFKDKYEKHIFKSIDILDEFLNDFYDFSTHVSIVNHLPDSKNLRTELIPYLDYQLNFKQFCNLFYQFFYSAYETKTIKTIINKDIIYHISAEDLHKYYPASRFIFLVRDSASNVYSCSKVGFWSSNVVGQSLLWNNLMGDIVNSYRKLPRESYMIVKYEDLIENIPETIKSICEYINISFDEKMLDNVSAANIYYDYANKRKLARGIGKSKGKRSDIHKSSRSEIDKKKLTEFSFTENEVMKINFLTRKIRLILKYPITDVKWTSVFKITPMDLIEWVKIFVILAPIKFYYQSGYYQKAFYRKINVLKLLSAHRKNARNR